MAMARNRFLQMLLLVALGQGLLLPVSYASQDAAALCEEAAFDAASETGVPAGVLRALSLTETGRVSDGRLRPWPWAINQGGEGRWFASAHEMIAHASSLIAAGTTNFDIGCFQLNYRWHAGNFATLDAMADPTSNARYAAQFLAQKHQASGDWELAAAAYHSATPEFAERYLARFREIYAGLEAHEPALVRIAEVTETQNLFPLLIIGNSGGGGSLVPLSTAARPLFGADE
jgi:hypothetical protein